MSQSTDLMGLGVPPLLAERMATAGIGPITVTTQGTNYATGYPIKNAQYLVYVPPGSGTGTLSLPPIGGDNGALLGDDFVIVNGASLTVSIYPPSTVSIVGVASSTANGSPITIAANTVLAIWAGPTTTTWIYK